MKLNQNDRRRVEETSKWRKIRSSFIAVARGAKSTADASWEFHRAREDISPGPMRPIERLGDSMGEKGKIDRAVRGDLSAWAPAIAGVLTPSRGGTRHRRAGTSSNHRNESRRHLGDTDFQAA